MGKRLSSFSSSSSFSCLFLCGRLLHESVFKKGRKKSRDRLRSTEIQPTFIHRGGKRKHLRLTPRIRADPSNLLNGLDDGGSIQYTPTALYYLAVRIFHFVGEGQK